MHRAALSFCRLDGTYDLFDLVPPLTESSFRHLLQHHDLCGVNVTIPHKQGVMPFLSSLTEAAKLVQAVNTISVDADGALTGHNTDLGGFIVALRELSESARWSDFSVPRLGEETARSSNDVTAVIVGAGGAARAALWGLVKLNVARVFIVARRVEQAEALAREFAETPEKGETRVFVCEGSDNLAHLTCDETVDMLVNSTPIGLTETVMPGWLQKLIEQLSTNRHGRESIVYDMVYSRDRKTMIVEAAERAGVRAAGGLHMLANQAALAFAFWTGVDVPAEIMSNALSVAKKTGQIGEQLQ